MFKRAHRLFDLFAIFIEKFWVFCEVLTNSLLCTNVVNAYVVRLLIMTGVLLSWVRNSNRFYLLGICRRMLSNNKDSLLYKGIFFD